MKRGCSILFALLFSVASHAGDPLDTWHWRNPTPLGVPLNGVCFGNDLFVAVGNAGTILVSPDGANWVAREADTFTNLRDVTFGGGLFVAVGDTGIILTSTDTKTWTRQLTGAFADLNSVTYGNGQFVAVGDGSFILSSTNGTNWTLRATGTIPLLDVTFGNGLFVAVGGTKATSYPQPIAPAQHLLVTSSDGINWAARDLSVPGFLSAVAYGGGRFVVAVNQRYNSMPSTLISVDGIHWEDRGGYFPNNYDAGINAVGHGNGVFIAVGGDDARTISWVGWKSSDGVNWSSFDMSPNSTGRSVAFANNRFVVVGGSETFGVPWLLATVTGESNVQHRAQLIQSSSLYGRLVHVGQHFIRMDEHSVAVSSNGVLWTSHLVSSNWGPNDVTYGGTEYVGAGADGKAATSTNARDWTLRETGETNALKGITWGGGKFVAVGDSGTILNSPDARSWSRVVVGNSNNLDQVVFANGIFACLDTSDGSLLISTNGLDWIQQVQTNFGSFGKLRSAGSFIIGAGFGGWVAVSTNGYDWNQVYPGMPLAYWAPEAAYGDGVLLITGQSTSYTDPYVTLLSSTNFSDWNVRGIHASHATFLSAAYGNGTFVLAGYNNMLLQSDPLTNTAPALAAAPATVFPLPGSEVTLSVLATGSSPLSYQWLRDGVSIAGAEEPFLYLTNPPITFTNQFSVVVSNSFGAITSAPVSVVVGVPASLALGMEAGTQLNVAGTPGRKYRVEYADSISASTTWTVLTNLVLNSTQEIVTDSTADQSGKRFYRAVLVP